MDWKSIQFDWNRARAFLVTAEEGSFSAAAKALKMSQSTLGRQVSALEEELGISLFERVGKGITMTPSALDLVIHVKAMAESANQLSMAATGQSQELSGNVVISATEIAMHHVVSPLVIELRRLQPGISIELIASNDAIDLRRREADIAIRNFKPNQPELIAIKLPDSFAYLYSHQDYLKQFAPITSAEDLARCQFIGFSDNKRYHQALNSIGIPVTEKNFTYLTESHLLHWHLTKMGAGIGVMVEVVGDLDYPSLVRVLPTLPPLPLEAWLVSHRELRTNRRIRFVFDYLVKGLSKSLIKQ